MKNKLIAVLCILSMLVSCMTVFAEGDDSETEKIYSEEEMQQMQDEGMQFDSEEEEEGSISELLGEQLNQQKNKTFSEAEALMISLGILDKDDDMEKKVTRGEFAHALYMILGYEYTSSSAVGSFTDVGVTTPYYAEISVLKDNNIISGYDDNSFRPDKEISAFEASKMLIRLIGIGWDETLSSENLSYYEIARQEKLFSDVPDFNIDYITNRQLAYILLNVFKCELKSPLDGKSKGIYMNTVLGIYKTEDVFSDDNRETKNGKLVIGNMEFPKPEKDYSDLLGQRVIVYYKSTNGGKSILSITADLNQDILDITDDDVVSFSNGVYQYTVKNNRRKSAKLEYDYDIIYNGVKVTEASDTASLMKPDMGYVRLIDNDNNGQYDVVVVWDYKLFIVDSYSEYNNILKSENGQNDISLKESDAFDILMAGTDNVLSTAQIAYNKYVLSVARSINDEYVKIYLCAETVSGDIKAVNSNNRTIKLDGKEYKYEKCMTSPTSIYGEFYIDQFGRIIYQSDVADSGNQYAYVIKMYEEEHTEKIIIRLYTQNNQKIDAKLANTVVIDGRALKNNDAINVALDGVTGSIIKFRLNSNHEITFIDTKKNNAGSETDGLNVCYEDTSSIGFNSLCMALCDVSTGLGKCPITLDTIVFCIVEPYSDDNIWVYNLTDFKNKYASGYQTSLGQVVVYNSDPDSYVGDVILNKREWMGTGYSYGTSVLRSGAVVTGISEYVDDSGDEYYMLNVERNGKKEEVKLHKDAIKFSNTGAVNSVDDSQNIYTISTGDVIRWRLDVNDAIDRSGLTVIYDCDRSKFFYEAGKGSYTKGTSSESGRWNRLWLYKRDGEHLISYNADMIAVADFDSSNIDAYKSYRYIDYLRDVSTYRTEVWIYDTASNAIEKGSIADFKYYLDDGAGCGEVLSFTNVMHRFFLIYR